MAQLTMTTYVDALFEAPRPGATTWYKGERCTVIDSQEMAEWMTRVLLPSGQVATVKTRELGLRAADVPAYLRNFRAA